MAPTEPGRASRGRAAQVYMGDGFGGARAVSILECWRAVKTVRGPQKGTPFPATLHRGRGPGEGVPVSDPEAPERRVLGQTVIRGR